MNTNDMNRTVRYLVTFCFLILAGCGSSPAVHYYALESMDNYVAHDDEGSPVLAVGAFRMPEYLNRSQMVTRGSGAEIIVDDVNRWAEPLDDAIHRVLASNLDVLLESLVVIAYPSAAVAYSDYRLIGRIDRFISDPDGMVELRVQWGIADSGGTVQLSSRRASFESQAAKPGDPGSIAEAMSDVLAQYSRAIATEVESIGLAQVP
jgi:uncharacterized lipoprotein YmbA